MQLGSCGEFNVDTDLVAALNPADFASRGACNRIVRVNCMSFNLPREHESSWWSRADQGRSVTVRVVDLCPGCGPGGIDLTPAAFQQLASLDVGRIRVDWNFV